MQLSDQVCSLEHAKKLKELGVRQNSIFDWVLNNHNPEYYLWLMSPYNRESLKFKDQYSAFTVAELGKMLRKFEEKIKGFELDYYITDNMFNILLSQNKNIEIGLSHIKEPKEADARAKALIHILDLKLIDVEDLNDETR